MRHDSTIASHRHGAALRRLVLSALLGCCALSAAQATTKDIVLSRIGSGSHTPGQGDALAVSILVEKTDGTLVPRSSDALFRTGERLRVKVVPSRSGQISVYNTNPMGVVSLVWSGDVRFGMETISPRMILTGASGQDQLHVVLEPKDGQEQGAWVNTMLKARKAGSHKDVLLDSQSTAQTTYVVNSGGQGVITTVRVLHTR